MELRQAIQAFRNAEAAGDVEAASRLARFIDQNLNQEPQPAAPAPESGVISSTIGGFKRLVSGLETAAGSIIDPQAAAQRGLQRQQELSEQYAPGASLDRVKQAYEKSGLLSAAGEAISQVPSALAEQFPNIAATIAGGKAGAMAGTAIAPGIGTVVGGLTGAAVPSLLQLYGSNLVRQAEETPQDISRLSALGAAVPGTALEVASTAIPLGRTFIGKILGPEAEKMLARGTNASLERAAKESVATSLVRGGGVGALAEIPTEVTQQMLERLQAGLPLTTDDALAEYAEAAYGATLVGTPFGAIARTAGRSSVQQQYAALKQQEDARLAVSEEELAQRFPDTLPGGFKIEQEELGREMGPQGYNIMAEGREQPLSVVDTEEEATAKLEALTKIRTEERENLLKEEQKINSSIQKAQQNLERLEATEQTDTDEYRSLKAQLPTMMDESAQKIKDTYDKIEALSKPLSATPFGEVERVNSQFKLLGPDSQQVGVFKTREQAEGAIEQSIGEDTFKQAKENQAAAKELYKTFVPQMRKFGLGDVGLNIVDRIENGAGGAYLDKLIRVSLEDSNPVQTMRHESLHALKDLGFFTPQQWKALERQAKKTWIEDLKKISQEEGKSRHDAYIELFTKEAQDKGFEGKELDQYVNDSLIEEAIADAFGAYDKGAKPPPGMIAALYRKIKNFFANLSQALRGAGFQSADDIFQAVERGELKPAAKAKEAKVEEKRSLPIMRGEEKPELSGKPTVDVIGKYFDDQVKTKNTAKLDYNDKQSFDQAVKTASDEVAYQLAQEKSGLDWYEDDIKEAFKLTSKFIPDLDKTENRLLFSVIAGLQSPNTVARDNWFVAAKTYEHYLATGNIPGLNPETGGLWIGGTQAPNKKVQLEFLDSMVKDMGQKQALEWLFSDHTVKEINQFRQKYGNIKSGIGGKLTDVRPGLYAFGPKVGPFVSNLNGIHDVTVDKWMTRTFNRYFGTMTGADGKIIDAPTEPQRRAVKALVNEVAKNAGIKPYQVQSLLWFYEQRLFTEMGVRSPSYGFSDGGRKYAESRGGRGGQKSVSPAAKAVAQPVKGKQRETTQPEQPVQGPGPRGGKGVEGAEKFSLRNDLRSYRGSNQAAPRPYKRKSLGDGGNVRVLGAQPIAQYEPVDPFKTLVSQYGFKSPAFYELGGENAKVYQQAIQKSKDASPYGAAVYVYPVEEYADMRLFLTEDGKAGFALKGDDIVSVFSGPPHKGSANSSLQLAVQEGGRRLDAFDTVLPELYNVNGFQVVGRMKWNEDYIPDGWDKETFSPFNSGEPDVVYMAYNPSDNRTVSENPGEYFDDPEELSKVQKNAVTEYQKTTKGIVLGTKQPGAMSFKGSHYGNARVEKLDASKYGTGLRGAERRRLDQAYDDRIKKRVYFYIQKEDGSTPIPEAGVGSYVYTQQFDNILPAGAEMSRLFSEARGDSNDFESSVIDAGYDGYAVPSMGMMVILNHNVPVNYVGPRAEVGVAKLSLRRTETKEFKDWLGRSKIVNKDGTPMVMYHGLAKDTTDFTRKTKRGAPIFLTDDPTFAETFAADSYEAVARYPEKYLSEEQIADGVKRAIAAIKKDYRKDSLGKEMIESLQTGNLKDATPEAREYIQKELISLLPTGPHIMPLYVRAENPFDYDNQSHVGKVVLELNKTTDSNGRMLGSKMFRDIENGKWDAIEDGFVQDAIKALGFDSFYVEEQGRKNLAVYEPNQVKSATGNVGTYSLDSNDVRYSLRNVAFPTAKEATEAADAVEVPDTIEFKRYIAGNQWVDEEGKAKKFYHATTSNFFEFNEGVIYLSDTAEEAEKWGRMAEDRLREQVYRALNKDEKLPFFQKAVDEAVSNDKITEAQGERFMRDAGRKIPEFGSYDLIKKEMDEALLSLAPERMKIMPLYARAVTPFDFRNKEHVQQVMAAYNYTQEMDRKIGEVAKQVNKEIGGAPTVNVENILDGLKGILAQGYPKVVERPDIIRTIRKLGFDGYITRRNRNAPMSYAVFKSEQVKSVTGNDGQFSVETKDVRYSLARFTPERVDKIVNEFGYTDGRTYAMVGRVNPQEFVYATIPSPSDYETIRSEAGKLDIEKLRAESQTPFIYWDIEKNAIVGHEGRHRMAAMADAGVNDAAVVVVIRDRYGSKKPGVYKPIDFEYITGQAFSGGRGKGLRVTDMIPAVHTQEKALKQNFTGDAQVKFSLPSVAPQINARVDMLTTAREQKGFAQRMIEAISPKTFSSFRQSYLNRYEQLSRYDKLRAEQMGGAALLADQSAESAALMSDLASGVAASAMGYGDRNGGVPVYRNGTTVIDRSVKGLIASLAPLAKYGDPKVYQYYQFWAGAKRAERLRAEGRERLYTQSDFAYARTLQTQFPEFVDVQRDLIAFNNGIVNYMVQTQVLSPEMGRKYTEHADYIPFYRQMEGERTSGPNIFSAISGVRPPKKLKGGDTAVADLLENLVRNTQSSIEAGMKNAAANRAIKVVSDVVAGGNVPGVDLVRLNTQETGPNIINVLENGKLVSYKTTDKLLVEAVGSLNMSELPFMGLISGPSNLLRNLVTKDPGFMMANLIRDSLSAYVTSGQSMTPIAGTMANFAKALARKSPGYEALLDAGVIGGYELSQNVEQSGESLARDLDKKAGRKDPILMRPFTSLWNALETGTTASDAATRAMVYERVLAETGNEAEALYRALEVMNFNRKGNSPLIRVLTAAVPFFNARLQGLDLFYRASTGNMNTNDAKAIQRKFFLRGSTMMALSVMYYMMVADDEEYKKQEQETKDGNWIIPSLGIRIPIPFEVGVLFKTMPERITAYALGNDTGKDLRESTVRNLINTFAFNPIPQTVKPVFEAATNFSFFTMRPIVGQGMGDVAPEFQVGPGTSKVAEMLGRQLGMSPMKIDHVLKGYTGTMGTYMVDATDLVMEQFGDSAKANKRFEQLPIIKRFALDPEARGTVTAYYELKDAVDTFTRTSNLLEKTSKPEDFVKYVQKNAGILGVKDYVLDLEKEMKELREMRRTITSSSMDGEQKKNLLITIGRAEQNLTSNIQTVKKVIASVQ